MYTVLLILCVGLVPCGGILHHYGPTLACGFGSLWWRFLVFWSNLGEMCPIWGTPWHFLVLQPLPLDEMRHEPVKNEA